MRLATVRASRRSPRAAFAVLAMLLSFARVSVAAGPPAPAPARQPIVLVEQPIRVEAQIAKDRSGFWLCALDVGREKRHYELRTVVRPEPAEDTIDGVVALLRRSMGWKDRYFFVTTSCGPGNAWKCESEAAFTLVGGRLVGLGSLAAREGSGFGTCYHDGTFLDLDTEFEGNDLTSHAGAPRIDVVLHERGGLLVGDADSSWALNAGQFAVNDSIARANTQPEVSGYRRIWEFALTPRLENAMLAKYCGRTAVLDSILAESRRVLPAEAMGPFQEMMSRVEPAALPRRSRLMPSPPR